jgi:hypothetical protein
MKTTFNFRFWLLSLTLLSLVFTVAAQDEPVDQAGIEQGVPENRVLIDDFSYSGQLKDNGWSPHNAAGTNPPSTTSPGLTYAGHPGSGVGNAALIGNAGGEDVNRPFAQQSGDGTTIYYSFLVNVTEPAANKTGDYFIHLGDRVDPTAFTFFAARVFVRVVENAVNFGLSNSGTPTWGTTNFAKNTTYLVIVKYTISTAGNDATSLWVIPSGIPANEAAAGAPEVTNTTTTGQDVIDAIGLRQGSSTTQPQVVIDALRVGTEWADIVSGVQNRRPRPPADFSGDLRTDWAVVRFNPSNFTLSWFVKNNDATGAEFGFPWGVATDLVVPADYDGDGREDVAVWRGAFGEGRTGFYIVRSRDLTTQFVPFGIESDDPSVTYDYTGDGRADPAIYRRGAVRNTFWFLASSGAVQGRHVPVQWGAGDVKAIVGDYTGDGIGDFTVVRAAAAGRGPDTVFIHPGTGGVDAPGADFFYNWGLRNFVWVPGDYDGDGRTDAAAIQTLPNGQMVWHFRPSTVNNDANFVSVPWGVSSDDPAPGDYDGDGRMDFAIFRNGQFFVLTQSGGQIFFPWGQTGDKPVQVIFPE